MTDSLSTRVARFEQDLEIAHRIVHGTDSETVETEGGPVRSFAKTLADYDAQLVQTVTSQNRAAAEGAAADAEAAAAAAVLARDAAQLLSDIFPDTDEGVANTGNGQFFCVPAGAPADSLILYRNTAGVAQEINRFPSSARVATLEEQVAELRYVPPAIDALLIDGASSKTVEIGSSVGSVTLSWSLSGAEPESQALDNGVGSVPVGTTSLVADGPFTSSRTWTLGVADTSPAGNPASASRAVSLNFRQKRYWGVADALSLDSAGIRALASEFATARQKTVAYDASAGGYPYYCYPAAWGIPSSVKVGGLAFSDYSTTSQSFVNASGYAEDYLVVRFNVRQTGSNIEVQFA